MTALATAEVLLEYALKVFTCSASKFEPLENEAQNDASIAITVIIIIIMMGRLLTEGAAGCVFVTATES